MVDFKHGDRSDAIANDKNMYVEIYHVNSGKAIKIKAALTNFEDKYNTDYSTDFFVMHTEPIRKWRSTVREISFALRIPANGVIESKENLAKMSLLARMLYGEQVREGGGFVPRVGGGPIFKIRFLNWIAGLQTPEQDKSGGSVLDFGDAQTSGLLGYISGFSFKPANIVEGFLTDHTDNDSKNIYPRFIDLSMTFYPIHVKSPAWIDEEFNYENFPYGLGVEDIDITSTNPEPPSTDPPSKATAPVRAAAEASVTGGDPADVGPPPPPETGAKATPAEKVAAADGSETVDDTWD